MYAAAMDNTIHGGFSMPIGYLCQRTFYAVFGAVSACCVAPVKELVSLQRRCSNNLNQVAVHANIYRVYPEEIDGLKRDYEKLWGEVAKVLRELSELVAK